MTRDSAGALAHSPVAGSSRSLSTARAVLQVLALLAARPEGVRADEIAKTLGKSVSTAYYLLTSLCEEGFAVHESKGLYRPARGLEQLTAAAEQAESAHPVHEGLAATVDELFLLTRKRSYLGVVRPGKIEIVAFRGRQGVPRMPGLGSEIRDSAHALAMGKVVLSLLGEAAVARYASRGLRQFTEHTITSAEELTGELEQAREAGFAVDREEFDANFCCIAAPIFDERGRFAAALGLSTSAHIFDADRDSLATKVLEVASAATTVASQSYARMRRRRSASHLEPVS
ncbi:MAG TPA: IclR family transcriptional regulator C-terminal domain-containing protein [Solirubrobacteraceae bacterium]|jgi:DNA-binding IclR family transcriptional regulator|nr:IclR family transcriptional regulator C-terminal domain-containing protein [Solirubrobacteraceae bacterium]